MKKKILLIIKNTFVISFYSLVIFFILNIVVGSIVYNELFNRYEMPDYEITPGLCYDDIKDEYEREEIKYKVKDNILQGYYYHLHDTNNLVVFSHGINDGGDSLLPLHKYFLDKGFNVFSYDNAGCFKSTGKANGFTEAFVDLDYTLSFLNSDIRFKDYNKLLVGFSCGGFAVGAINNLSHKNIIGCISISGFYDSKTIIQEKGKEYTGILAYFGIPVLNFLERDKFGKYLDYNAVDGINKNEIPYLVIQGELDPVVRYNIDSIYSKSKEIKNPNVMYYLAKGKDHGGVIYSNNANKYKKEVLADLSKLSYEDKKAYNKNVDDFLYSELDNEVIKVIDSYLNQYIYI